MLTKLAEAKAQVRTYLRAGEHGRALALCDALLAAAPGEDRVRLVIADLLRATGNPAAADRIDEALALHFVQAGHALPALVAALAGARASIDRIAETFGAGSEHLARFTARPAPPDPEAVVELPAIDESEPLGEVAARAERRALDLSAHPPYQPQVHPVAFFSELDPASLRAVLPEVTVHHLEDGALVVKQGDAGSSLYLVAGGELRVVAQAEDGATRELARLHEGSLFGEMALMTRQPRTASVVVVGEADVIEVPRTLLDRASAQMPALKEALDGFARERLIRNLLATSPLFTPFTKDQQAELLRRFDGSEVDPGTVVIQQGQEGQGLFVVLSGELEVSSATEPGAAATVLARLQTGDIFGEMSLISSQPTSATVRALVRCNLLFLGRVYVERLAGAIPEVHAYFAEVAAQRALDNRIRRSAAALPDVAIEVDASGFVLL